LHYDAIVVGAGVAGASTAYFLKKAGRSRSVLVLEKDRVCSGGSYPAGAFLSPKISKPSPYKEYLNNAFLFSINFYKQNFPKQFYQCGLKKIPYDEKDIKRCQSYEPFINLPYSKDRHNYFFPDAGLVNPIKICHALLKDIEVKENFLVKDLRELNCKHLILATGSDKLPIDLSYIKTKNIAGYRYDVEFDGFEKIKHNIFKDVSISTYHEGVVAVGATHIKPNELKDLQLHADEDSFGLLEKARDLHPMENLKVLKSYIGYRNSTFDFFPIVGKLIDEKSTLNAYPSITKGTKIPTDKYHYHKEIYIHSALGSRGFVYAPYNAYLLANLILKDKEIDDRLSPVRLFKKWALNPKISHF